MNKLSPENLFVPSQENVRAILAHYNLPFARFSHAAHGIENLTLFVWLGRRKYVLRVYPQGKKSNADILLELDFMSHLRNHGLPLPAIILSADNQSLVSYELDNKKWQCFLMEYAQGVRLEAFTLALLDHMATLQAQMHILGEQYAKIQNIRGERVALREIPGADELLKNAAPQSSLRALLERVNAFVVEFDEALPKGLSHFDFDIDNLLTKNDRVTALLDFGDMECMPLVVCLGYTLWDVLFEQGGGPASVARYLQRYQEVRSLNFSEKEVLQAIILFRHYVITNVQMHFGNFSQNDLDKALQQEWDLRNLKLNF